MLRFITKANDTACSLRFRSHRAVCPRAISIRIFLPGDFWPSATNDTPLLVIVGYGGMDVQSTRKLSEACKRHVWLSLNLNIATLSGQYSSRLSADIKRSPYFCIFPQRILDLEDANKPTSILCGFLVFKFARVGLLTDYFTITIL
jgi:hypothetical protein